jgi:hypothetical protein
MFLSNKYELPFDNNSDFFYYRSITDYFNAAL